VLVDGQGEKDGANVDLEVVHRGRGKRKSVRDIAPKEIFERGITTIKLTTISAFKKEDWVDACKAIALLFNYLFSIMLFHLMLQGLMSILRYLNMLQSMV